MSDGLVSFGDYVFPATLQDYNDNFANTMPNTVHLPGIDGGWNEEGNLPATTEIGLVMMGFYLIAENRADMDAMRDAVSMMASWGIKKLVYQPTDPAKPMRFCWARVHNIIMQERKNAHTDLWQEVRVYFQVPYPIWFVGAYEPAYFDGTYNFNGAITFGNGALSVAASGTETSTSITNNGNTLSIPIITIEPATGQSCENPKVQRIVEGVIVDEFSYQGVFSAGSILAVDGYAGQVLKGAANGFDANFNYIHPAFMRLAPGSNSIKVKFKNAGDAATVRWWYWNTYR